MKKSKIIEGSINYEGQISADWDAVDAPDISRYNVFISADSTGNYIIHHDSNSGDTEFNGTMNINTLSDYIYLKVSAIDNRDNESDPSAPIRLEIPDIVAPSSPEMIMARPYKGGVGLNWDFSASEDRVEHKLQRRISNSSIWTDIVTISKEEEENYMQSDLETDIEQLESQVENLSFRYQDTTVRENTEYDYRLTAVDENENMSYSSIISVETFDLRTSEYIYNMACYLSSFIDSTQLSIETFGNNTVSTDYKNMKGCIVSWDYTLPDEVHSFIVYRAKKFHAFEVYDTYLLHDGRPNPASSNINLISASAFSINAAGNPSLPNGASYMIYDTEVEVGKTYQYKIIANLNDGSYSDFSDVIEITIQ